MSFDVIPEDKQESYPCECGGRIYRFDEMWSCDSCDFEAPVAKVAKKDCRDLSLSREFEDRLSEIIGKYTKRGLSKIDCVRNLEWVLGNVKMS